MTSQLKALQSLIWIQESVWIQEQLWVGQENFCVWSFGCIFFTLISIDL